MDVFRTDNTEGYTGSELAELNCRWEDSHAHLDPDSDVGKSARDRLLRDFDSRSVNVPQVICYQDGQVIREATREELERSLEAAELDGEAGVYQDPVTGVSVYVTGDLSDFEEAS